MARNQGGPYKAVVLGFVALCFGLPIATLLCAPAVAAHIELSGAPHLAQYLREWLWGAAVAPLLALLLVRVTASRGGRLRHGRMPRGRRPLAYVLRAVLLLGAANAVALVQLTRTGRTDTVVADGVGVFGAAALAGISVLVTMYLWDRRAEPVTVEAVRAAAQDADRALRRVRAENERVRRQAEQVQARLAAARSETDFHRLRTLHRESFMCADGAYSHYQSAQASLHTMSSMLRRVRTAPQQWLTAGRAAKAARAELRAAATHLAQTHGELRVQVDQGLGLVRTLNANTADLKHSIRDGCGESGRRWFEALEQRIDEARATRV